MCICPFDVCRSSLFVGELGGFVYALPSLIEEEDIITEVSSPVVFYLTVVLGCFRRVVCSMH